MFQVDVAEAERRAPRLKVMTQEEGELLPFKLTAEQMIVMSAMAAFPRLIVLKGRQVFASTAATYYAFLFACANPGIKIALVADIAQKAKGLLQKVNQWCIDGKIRTKAPSNTEIITLWNGAELHAVTANSNDNNAKKGSKEAKAGRSHSFGLIVLSEFAYYARDKAILASMTRSALKGAHIIIESTATPAENEFRAIWEKAWRTRDNPGPMDWHPVFLSIEQHVEYQLPADTITDEQWEDLRTTRGFKSRTHAAYWLVMCERDLNGDVHRALREAPIKPEDAFSFAEGRWIFGFRAATPRETRELIYAFAEGIPGGWRFYDEPDDSGVVIGIDTGGGVGGDASAIAIIGRRHGNLIATFVARDCIVPNFIGVSKRATEAWRPAGTNVEGNGIGKSTYQELSMLPVARCQEHTSSDVEKPIRMNLVKLAIESGQIAVGPELAYEVAHSEQKRPTSNKGAPVWDGPDDLLNAIGFALVWRRDHPWRESMRPINPMTHIDRRHVRQRHAKRGKVF